MDPDDKARQLPQKKKKKKLNSSESMTTFSFTV